MTIFERVHVARKAHSPFTRTGGCENCRGTIEPGHTYSRETVTPHDSDIGNERLYSIKMHHPYGSCHQQRFDGRFIPAEDRIAAWNAVWPAGSRVIARAGGARTGPCYETVTVGPARVLGITAVIPIAGDPMAHDLDTVMPLPTLEQHCAAYEGHPPLICRCAAGTGGCSHRVTCSTCLAQSPKQPPAFPCPVIQRRLGLVSAPAVLALESWLWSRANNTHLFPQEAQA